MQDKPFREFGAGFSDATRLSNIAFAAAQLSNVLGHRSAAFSELQEPLRFRGRECNSGKLRRSPSIQPEGTATSG
jgi:hypothetical protein